METQKIQFSLSSFFCFSISFQMQFFLLFHFCLYFILTFHPQISVIPIETVPDLSPPAKTFITFSSPKSSSSPAINSEFFKNETVFGLGKSHVHLTFSSCSFSPFFLAVFSFDDFVFSCNYFVSIFNDFVFKFSVFCCCLD